MSDAIDYRIMRRFTSLSRFNACGHLANTEKRGKNVRRFRRWILAIQGCTDEEVRAIMRMKTQKASIKLVRLPNRFYDDHYDRSLPTPEEVRTTQRHVFVRVNDPALPHLLDDARYYAHPYGPDNCSRGLIISAKATVQAIEKATGVKR